MPRELKISVGQHSDRGRKEINQDFHGVLVPNEPLLSLKGVSIVLADGIGSSAVSQVASETAIKSFLTDYYCTSDSWSVKTSAQRVISAVNSWLHAQNRAGPNRYDMDRGYVCTLSAMVVKSASAHVFHVGDSRVCRVAGATLEQLTEDHRVVISSEQSYLARALGASPRVEIDYRSIPVERGDLFVLTTDGVHEWIDARQTARLIHENAGDLDAAARAIVAAASQRGSPDNMTIQIARIDELPDSEAAEILERGGDLPLPPLLEARMVFDGYRIVRQLHASSRSHVYLAVDIQSEAVVCLKIPSIDMRGDAGFMRRFRMEEWVARRVDSPHVLKSGSPSRKRNFVYVVAEFIEGQTLAQWMIDNPAPDIETVRSIVEQIAWGLRAFHRMEMLHQDLRPANIMIDKTGTVKIIDFGSVKVAGVVEAEPAPAGDGVPGTFQYAAPEYFTGEQGTPRSDLFSLGVIAYHMLTGRLPYGAEVAKARTKARQRQLLYRSAREAKSEIPDWIDGALKKATHVDPARRHEDVFEFTWELRNPNPEYTRPGGTPLIERNPLLFWKVLSFALLLIVACLLVILVNARR